MDQGKRKRNWFSNNHKKRKPTYIEAGMKGFLCTCNFQEKNCIRDVYKLLNEFSDKLKLDEEAKQQEPSPQEPIPQEPSLQEPSLRKPEIVIQPKTEEEEDIATALTNELGVLQAENIKLGCQRKFQVMETGVKNALFIQTTIPDPLELAMSIIKEVFETKTQRSRYLLRLLPVEVVCKATMEDLSTKAYSLLGKYFSREPKTFSIVFNRHSNSNMKRAEVIEDLASIITEKNPGNKADLKNPEIAVVVEAIRGICLLSVAPNYMLYKKYNLMEMCNPTKKKESEKDDATDPVDSKEGDQSSKVEEDEIEEDANEQK